MQTMTTAPVADDDGLRAEDEQDTTDQSDAEIIRPVLVMRRPIPLATAKDTPTPTTEDYEELWLRVALRYC
jgi:hypothetical protein